MVEKGDGDVRWIAGYPVAVGELGDELDEDLGGAAAAFLVGDAGVPTRVAMFGLVRPLSATLIAWSRRPFRIWPARRPSARTSAAPIGAGSRTRWR